MATFVFDHRTFKERPRHGFKVDPDLAHELGVVRWFPLAGGSLHDYKTRSALTPVAVGRTGTPGNWEAPLFSGASASYLAGDAVAEISAISQLTVMAWGATNTTASSGGGGGLRYIVSNEIAGQWQFTLRYSPSAGFIQGLVLTSGVVYTAASTTTVVVNRPMCMAMQLEAAGSVSCWLNGRREAGTSTGGTLATNTTNVLSIGSDNGFNARLRQFNGWISDVVIATKAWTPGQMALMSDPATAWSLYWVPGSRAFFDISTSTTFNAGWARGSNVILQPGM